MVNVPVVKWALSLLLLPNFTSGFVEAEKIQYESIQPIKLQYEVHPLVSVDSNWPHHWKTETATEDVVVEPPLLVGSFNIQTLGKSKFKNLEVMDTVKKIILRYDVILIMEIMLADTALLQKLLTDVNNLVYDGAVYNMTVGERQVDTQESCAYFYRTDKLKLMKSESFENPNNDFYRKPLIAVFHSSTLRDMIEFVFIGHHAKPDRAVKELDALAELYDFVRMKYNIEDVLLMGDFNADCTYVKEQDWERISLWTRGEFTWVIRNRVDTTTNYRSCALDRFVYAGENMNDGVIIESAKIFNFQEEFDLTTDETRAVSDHWPIELQIRGKVSLVAEKNIVSDICFKVKDLRSPEATKEKIFEETDCFTVTVIPDGFLLRNKTDSISSLKSALANISSALPDAVTREQYHSTLYKLEHGALNDDSSNSDINYSIYEIDVVLQSSSSTVMVCKRSSIN